jgi:hypothetical protein
MTAIWPTAAHEAMVHEIAGRRSPNPSYRFDNARLLAACQCRRYKRRVSISTLTESSNGD